MAKLYLKYSGATLGSTYNGTDGRDSLTVEAEGIVEVSEEEAGKLLKDFPKDFSKASKKDVDDNELALKKAKEAADEAAKSGKPPEYGKAKAQAKRSADSPPPEYPDGWKPPKADPTWKTQNRG